MFEDAEIVLRPVQDSWTTIPIAQGTEFRGVLAGPIRRVYCHHDGTSSKPCRSEITKGAVKCYCQTEPTKGRVYGYAPFIAKDGGQVVVMLSATTTKKMMAYKRGDCVRLVRPDRPKAALVPHMMLAEEMGTKLVERIRNGPDADIAYYLLSILWHDELLVRHFYGPQVGDRKAALKRPPLVKKKLTDTPAPASDNALSLETALNGVGAEWKTP